MHAAIEGMYNGAGIRAGGRFRSSSPLPDSVRIRQRLRSAAVRWACAGVCVGVISSILMALPVPKGCGQASHDLLMLRVWVAVTSVRVVLGAAVRTALWRAWDVCAHAATQAPRVYALVRVEFIAMLVSVLWSTVGFMYVYGASAPECAASPLPQYALALVGAMYMHFLLPVILASVFRLAQACAWSRVLRGLRRAAHAGLFVIPAGPIDATMLRPLPEEKFQRARFPAEPAPACSICMTEYADGEPIRVLPCAAQHHFHTRCIDTWLRRTPACPLCRASMVDPDWAAEHATDMVPSGVWSAGATTDANNVVQVAPVLELGAVSSGRRQSEEGRDLETGERSAGSDAAPAEAIHGARFRTDSDSSERVRRHSRASSAEANALPRASSTRSLERRRSSRDLAPREAARRDSRSEAAAENGQSVSTPHADYSGVGDDGLTAIDPGDILRVVAVALRSAGDDDAVHPQQSLSQGDVVG